MKMDKDKTSPQKEEINTKKAVVFLLRKYCAALSIFGVCAVCLIAVAVNGMLDEIHQNDSICYSDSSAADPVSEGRNEKPESNGVSAVAVSTDVVFPLDINLATKEQLMLVKGIGEKTAGDIIAYREAHGVITSIEALSEIDGIGEASIELLREYFYVSDDVFVPYTSATSTTVSHTTAAKSTTNTTSRTRKETTTKVTTSRITKPRTEPQPEETTEETETSPDTTAETEPPEPQRVPVDINHATAQEIADALLLPIEKAEDIVSVREQILYFSNVAELYLVESLTKQDIMDITDYIVILPL